MSFDITKKWRWLVALGAVFVPAIVMGAVTVPFSFSAGTPIRASEVNANFQALKAGIDGLDGGAVPAPIGTLSLAGLTEVIPIRRFGHNIAQTGTRAVVDDLEISAALGNPSPQLNLTLNQGQHLQTANIALGNLLIRLEDVLLTAITLDGTQADGVPLQKLRIGFQRIEWTWQPSGQPARVVSYDRAANTGSGGADTTVSLAFFGAGVTPDPNFIGITGYTTDQSCPASSGGGTTVCRVEHSPLAVTKTSIGAHLLDDLAAATRGQHLQTVDLQWLRLGVSATPEIQHRVTLEDVLVASVKMSTAPDGTLTESAGFTYQRIRWQVGSSISGWDLAANRTF